MPIKIVVTGPESTGKTSLCTQLSERYKCTMIPEFSREYLKNSTKMYQLEDIEKIGVTQNLYNDARAIKDQFIFCDSDALTCYIWAKEKFNVKSAILNETFKNNLPDLYLLCYPDLKWEYDPLRESENDLERLFQSYLIHISTSGALYSIIYGCGIIRISHAVFLINNLFPEMRRFVV